MKKLSYKIPESLSYGVSSVEDGNLSCKWGDDERVIKNRENFLKKLNLSLDDCVMIDLEHKDKIEIVSREDKGSAMRCEDIGKVADSMITSEKGVFLFLLTADCLPLMFFDEKNSILGLAHLSWMTTGLYLSKKTVQSMVDQGSAVEDIQVYVGPGIQKESYLFPHVNQKDDEGWKDFIVKDLNGDYAIDVVGFNIRQLLDMGVLQDNIFLCGIDTFTSPDYFSHYRSKRTNEPERRFATVVGMKT